MVQNHQGFWPLLALLLLGSFCVGVAFAGPTETAQQVLFNGQVPDGFVVLRGGPLEGEAANHHTGHYLILQNTGKKLMALVMKSKPNRIITTGGFQGETVLEKENLAVVTTFLFDHYVGLKHFEILNERNRWIRLSDSSPVAFPTNWLLVKFEDKFSESDLVTKLAYPDGSQTLILIGAPATGNYQDCAAFRDDFFRMERAAKAIANTGRLVNGAIAPTPRPSKLKTYFKNLPKSHYRKHCQSDNKAIQ